MRKIFDAAQLWKIWSWSAACRVNGQRRECLLMQILLLLHFYFLLTNQHHHAHLHSIGVILWAAHHASGPVEAGWGLEGDGEVVGLWDVLHGGGAGVRLHDSWKLEWQHEREQLLQYGGPDGGRGGKRKWNQRENPHSSVHMVPLTHLYGCWNTALMWGWITYHYADCCCKNIGQ